MSITTCVKSPFPDLDIPDGVEVHEFLFERLKVFGDMTATTCGMSGKSLTFHQIYRQAQGLGAALIQSGHGRGEVAAIILPNCLEYSVVVLGCWCAGLTVATLNPRYTDLETQRQIQICTATILFTNSDTVDIALQAKADISELQTIIFIGTEQRQGCLSFCQMTQTDPFGIQFSSGKDTDTSKTVAWLPFSSGTTGPPKCWMTSHASVLSGLLQFVQDGATSTTCFDKTGYQERIIGLLPFFHIFALEVVLLLGLYQGAHIMILERFIPSSFLKTIRHHKPTILHLVTPLITHIVNSEDYSETELGSVHSVFAGGAPIGKSLITKFIEKAGRPIFFMEGYGLSETLATHTITPSFGNTKAGSIGRLLPSNRAKIIDLETGDCRGSNENGELLIKCAVSALGYFQNEESTKEVVDSEGWIHTGDVGYYDEDGFFYVVDRIKELVKVNAFQVAPSELEDLLRKHDKVADCAVVGIPSEKHGEVPRAYIVPKAGDISEEEIHNYLNPLVVSYKRLKGGIEFVACIPKSPSGKILRRELKETYQRMHTN